MKHAPRGPLKSKRHPIGDGDPITAPAEAPLRFTSPRCTAHSKQSGQPCRYPAIPGGYVCRYHGGNAPQVRASALERLQGYQHMAIDRLIELLKDPAFPSTSYQAVRDILDRTMGKPAETVQQQHSGEIAFRWQGETEA